jgi:hypothetical protein
MTTRVVEIDETASELAGAVLPRENLSVFGTCTSSRRDTVHGIISYFTLAIDSESLPYNELKNGALQGCSNLTKNCKENCIQRAASKDCIQRMCPKRSVSKRDRHWA